MDIATATATANAASASPAAAGTGRGAISADFETFLTMLTTQLRNQDPLNPLESTDFAVQLATFSQVEQQVRGNGLLEDLGARLGVLGMAQLSGWVGMEARAAVPVAFDGAPVTLAPQVATGADRAVLVARNELGNAVERRELALPPGEIAWAGFDGSGVVLPSGSYSFEVESYAGDVLLAVDPVETFARVTEARIEDGRTILVLGGGTEVAADAISGLRAVPDTPAPGAAPPPGEAPDRPRP